jgi:hypothetical protein
MNESARPQDATAPAYLKLEAHSSDFGGCQPPGCCFPQCLSAEGALERPTSHRAADDAASHHSLDCPTSDLSPDCPASHCSLHRCPPNASLIGHE